MFSPKSSMQSSAKPPPGNIRRTFLQHVDATNFRQALNAIHSGAITTIIDFLPVNGVLGVQTPLIAEQELEFPRETRVTLAQLRSGYCSRLNSYLPRLDPDIQNLCPACNGSSHDTNHLFACPMNPTHLTLLSLRFEPVETACFLGLPLSDFDDS